MGKIVGFDIGEGLLKMALFSGGRLEKTVALEIPDELVSEGVIQYMDTMAAIIREAARANGFPRGDCAVSLPDSLVYTRSVTVPVMTEAQLKFNLPYEFADYLGESKDKYFFDYSVREVLRDEDDKPVNLRLYACAVAKSTMAGYRDMFAKAGYRMACAVPGEFAYSASVRSCVTEGEETDLCLVDIGHRSTQFVVYHGDEPTIRRTIDIGIMELDALIADTFGVSGHNIYSYKTNNHDGILDSPEAVELYNRLAVEITRAVNFYNYNNREASLSELYLCGGGCAIPALRRTIGEDTGLPLHSAAELLPENNSKEPWLYLRACGCAMEGGSGK